MSERTPRSPLWWVAMPLCLLYAVGVFAFFVLRFLLPAWPPPLELFGFLGPFLYAPLALLVPLAVVSRARPAIAATLAVALLFFAIYLPLFLPRLSAAPTTAGAPITAMTYNLGAPVSQPAALTAAIASVGADVVAVEELYPAAATAFAEVLAARYPYRILPQDGSKNGLLSRYPIVAYQYFMPAGIGREALQATLDLNGRPALAIVFHPEPPIHAVGQPGTWPPGLFDIKLEAQLADIISRARGAGGPALVMGDFNMPDQSRPYVVISRALGDAFWEAGFGFGFTLPTGRRVGALRLPGPLVRIDYIFHNDAFYARRAYVGCRGSSDHCYVVAELGLLAPGAQP